MSISKHSPFWSLPVYKRMACGMWNECDEQTEESHYAMKQDIYPSVCYAVTRILQYAPVLCRSE